jgi:hypothetical protein
MWLRIEEPLEALWALDQALRCRAVKAVWACLGRWEMHLNGRWFRRFQLAAERSGCLGIFVRSSWALGRPSWAELQLTVAPAVDATGERGLRVALLRCRGPSKRGAGDILGNIPGNQEGNLPGGREESDVWLTHREMDGGA